MPEGSDNLLSPATSHFADSVWGFCRPYRCPVRPGLCRTQLSTGRRAGWRRDESGDRNERLDGVVGLVALLDGEIGIYHGDVLTAGPRGEHQRRPCTGLQDVHNLCGAIVQLNGELPESALPAFLTWTVTSTTWNDRGPPLETVHPSPHTMAGFGFNRASMAATRSGKAMEVSVPFDVGV